LREPVEIREPDLHERPDGLLEAGLARDRERLLVALARLSGRYALLQPVVAGDEQLLDLCARILVGHRRSLTGRIRVELRNGRPDSRSSRPRADR